MDSMEAPEPLEYLEWSERDFLRLLKRSKLRGSGSGRNDPKKNSCQRQEQGDLSAFVDLPPLLRLPQELRDQILREVIDSELSAYEGGVRVLSFNHITQDQPSSLKPKLLNIFLINKLLHDEAEEVLWKHHPISLQAWSHFRFPLRQSHILNLSAYAYANIRTLWMPLYVSSRNGFSAIKVGYNNIIGNTVSSNSTWQYETLALKLTNLRTLFVNVHESKDMRREGGFRGRCLEAIVSMLGLFIADRILICCESEDTIFDLRMAARYRIEDYETRCNFTLSETSQRDWKMMDLDENLAPKRPRIQATQHLEEFPYQKVVVKNSSTSTIATARPVVAKATVVTGEVKARSQVIKTREERTRTARPKTSEPQGGVRAAEVKREAKRGSKTSEGRKGFKTQESKGGFFDNLWGKLKV